MSVLYTDNPKSGNWKATPAIITNLQDPDLFLDDDGSAYMFWGSSNKWPIRGMKLNKNHRFIQEGEKLELSISTQRNMVGNVLEKIMPIPCWAAISKDRG